MLKFALRNFVADEAFAFATTNEQGDFVKANGARVELGGGRKKQSEESECSITDGAIHNRHFYQESSQNCNLKRGRGKDRRAKTLLISSGARRRNTALQAVRPAGLDPAEGNEERQRIRYPLAAHAKCLCSSQRIFAG
jgi:hypothetical protein